MEQRITIKYNAHQYSTLKTDEHYNFHYHRLSHIIRMLTKSRQNNRKSQNTHTHAEYINSTVHQHNGHCTAPPNAEYMYVKVKKREKKKEKNII